MAGGDLTILIVSYDGYMDMWPMFFKCMHDNWPDCPFVESMPNGVQEHERLLSQYRQNMFVSFLRISLYQRQLVQMKSRMFYRRWIPIQ